MSATDFALWLDAESSTLDTRLTALERLCTLLKPGQDAEVGELAKQLKSIEDLRQAGSKLDQIVATLGLDRTDGGAVRDRDWGDDRTKAEWTLGFLGKYADRPPQSLIRAATLAEIRQPLQEAVRRNLAARSDSFLESWEYLKGLFDPEQDASTGIRLGEATILSLLAWVEQRLGDAHLIQEWVKYCELSARITQVGLGSILAEIIDGKLKVEEAGDAFLLRLYRCWLDWVYAQDAELRTFSVEGHERLIDQFRTLDRDAVRLSYTRIRQTLLNDPTRPRPASLDAPSTSELGTLLREINKKRRHLPLRHLFARIPTVLSRLKPCMMMSPLAVSTYLNTKDIRFDLVVFDEASQVRPYDAISAIYRGNQILVAGDQKQLPPTSFFERSVADEDLSSDGEEVVEGLSDFESILDVCGTLGLARRRLRWHYRSRREPLIAFSNRHIYDNELVTFPSVLDTGENSAVRFEHVADGRWKSGTGGGFNAVEARRTAELVMGHFRRDPSRSLGVIAFSQRQQEAILDELEGLRRLNPALEGFFGEDAEEPFFVKNLENVQGDERDVIFLSIGYGPDENGRVAMRFGPLNRQGGERRLNVAVTRARSAMTVISSLRSHDIDLSRTAAVGPKLLRAYLDFAERGISALGSGVTQVDEHDFDSPFEKEVADALTRRGLAVRRQVGCSGFRIDLAVVDPERPGRFLIGIECDGATYHSSATARDRDRLRQEVLESLGWTIVRIWSTDWVRTPDAQVERVIAAASLARERSGDPDAGHTGPMAPGEPADEVPLDIIPVGREEGPEARLSFEKIDDVPNALIEKLVLAALGSYGATGEDELKQAVARQLGFKRTGKNIVARLDRSIVNLTHAGKITRSEANTLKLNDDQVKNYQRSAIELETNGKEGTQ